MTDSTHPLNEKKGMFKKTFKKSEIGKLSYLRFLQEIKSFKPIVKYVSLTATIFSILFVVWGGEVSGVNYISHTRPQNSAHTFIIPNIPRTATKDQLDTIKKGVKRDTPAKDSIQIIKYNPNPTQRAYTLSDTLPLSYQFQGIKFTFRKQNSNLVVDFYYKDTLKNTFNCLMQDNRILIPQRNFFFAINYGKFYYISYENPPGKFQLYSTK